jgi:hypothetical protein
MAKRRYPKKCVSFIIKPTVACVPSKGDTLFQVSADFSNTLIRSIMFYDLGFRIYIFVF